MGLLDDENFIQKPWTPPKSRRYVKQTALSQEQRDFELNNFDREEEDYDHRGSVLDKLK